MMGVASTIMELIKIDNQNRLKVLRILMKHFSSLNAANMIDKLENGEISDINEQIILEIANALQIEVNNLPPSSKNTDLDYRIDKIENDIIELNRKFDELYSIILKVIKGNVR